MLGLRGLSPCLDDLLFEDCGKGNHWMIMLEDEPKLDVKASSLYAI